MTEEFFADLLKFKDCKTRAEADPYLRKAFDFADQDGDGKITLEEHYDYVQAFQAFLVMQAETEEDKKKVIAENTAICNDPNHEENPIQWFKMADPDDEGVAYWDTWREAAYAIHKLIE